MKKLSILILLLISVTFTNCKKDEPEEVSKPVPVEIKNFDESGNLSFTETYEYNEKRITKKTTVSGSDTTVSTYNYSDESKGLLTDIVNVKNGQPDGRIVFEYNIDNLLTKQEEFDANGTSIEKGEMLHFTNGKPDQIKISTIDATYGLVVLIGTIDYTGDNATAIHLTTTVSGVSVNITQNITCDTNPHMFTNVSTVFLPNMYKNNQTIIENVVSALGSNQVSVLTNTYTYDSDNYPTKIESVENGDSMGYVEITYEKK
jgi:hypothetical protein